MPHKYTNFASQVYPYLVVVSVFLLVSFSFYFALQSLQATTESGAELEGEEMVSGWDKRQRRVNLLLPDHGIIGYIADWDIPNYKYSQSDQDVEYLLMQYTVAPLVLDRGTRHSIILGNFNDPGDDSKIQYFQNNFALKLIESYSNEVHIFSNPGL